MLGAQAAQVLQISHVAGHVLVYLGNTWFTVVGILKPALLDSTLDSDVFISLPVGERMFQLKPNPSEIYLRANINDAGRVSGLLAPTADPQNPDGVQVSRPSNALQARAAAKGQFTTLLLALGGVALLVGAIGIANIMVISVLERRSEIGLRRALGATRRHIRVQFLTESAMLAAVGGVAGLLLGAGATEVYALTKHEPFVVPLYASHRRAGRRARDRYAGRRLSGRQGGAAQPHRGAADIAAPHGHVASPRHAPARAATRSPIASVSPKSPRFSSWTTRSSSVITSSYPCCATAMQKRWSRFGHTTLLRPASTGDPVCARNSGLAAVAARI